MMDTPTRRSHFRELNLLERLNTLLAELDMLPLREKPLAVSHAGKARRLLAEAEIVLGTSHPLPRESRRDPAEIFARALLNSTSLKRRIHQRIQALRRKNMESYPRPSSPA